VYTVKQLSDLAGVSIRTLHYYDEIGLLEPASVGQNGYRYYDETDLLKLQQILFFREMDLGLLQIKDIVDRPEFDLLSALQAHRRALQDKIQRLQCLIDTVDSTLMHLTGDVEMSKKQLFAGFSEEKQKQYEQEAIEQFGEDAVRPSIQRWNSYSAEKKQQIMTESGAIYTDLIGVMDKGPASADVHAILARWHQHMRYFYEPSLETLRGLGQHYNSHPEFHATFEKMHPDLPQFLEEAIGIYVDKLEGKG
jgi:MerR family transcriptional regulator, thiopeptide resistance regulator